MFQMFFHVTKSVVVEFVCHLIRGVEYSHGTARIFNL